MLNRPGINTRSVDMKFGRGHKGHMGVAGWSAFTFKAAHLMIIAFSIVS